MTKKEHKPTTIWSILQNNTLVGSYSSFDEAKNEAEKTIEVDESAEVKILEVVRAWELRWPEEPSPEVLQVGLDQL